MTSTEIRRWVTARVAEAAQLNAIDVDIHAPFASFGLSSMAALELSGDIERWLGREVSPLLVYEYPSIDALSNFLAHGAGTSPPAAAPDAGHPPQPIAVIGLGCRVPGVGDPDAFWDLLRHGRDAITEIPPDRWDVDAFYDPRPRQAGRMQTRWGGFVSGMAGFDAGFFGIARREASQMDPQQRMLLEVAWEALEHAGQAPDQLAGSNTGVFVGISSSDSLLLRSADGTPIDAYAATGHSHSIAANRLSYILDLRGPSVSVDTACSSSLVAVDLAFLNLRLRRCDLAIAGGVNVVLAPHGTIAFSQMGAMAADGRCKTFDASADGYVRSEGAGMVVLKRLDDARRDGDRILAVLRGSAVNQDGRTNGLTAPNGASQQAVIREALAVAGMTGAQISYIEAHGTGTPLGDPIEFHALASVLGRDRPSGRTCLVGSVKANLGHLEAAAGIASLIKVVLALQHKAIPPQIHLSTVNPEITVGPPFAIPATLTAWQGVDGQRAAGVSSFGFGGTNAHVIVTDGLEQDPAVDVPVARPRHLLALSAPDESGLARLTTRYRQWIDEHPDASLPDVCFSANTGRAHLRTRAAFAAADLTELRALLDRSLGDRAAGTRVPMRTNDTPRIAFVMPGQGCQYHDMAAGLYQTQPVFRAAFDSYAAQARPYLDRPLHAVVFEHAEDAPSLSRPLYAQTSLFVLALSLADLWRSWGVTPDAVLGHSAGEYAAACIAGIFSVEDGLKLIAERARVTEALPSGGGMAAVFAEAAVVDAFLTPERTVSIAARNSAQNTVISGLKADVDAVVQRLAEAGIDASLLDIPFPAHSPLIEPVLDDFEASIRGIRGTPSTIQVASTLKGRCLRPEEIPDARYWRDHLRHPVEFARASTALIDQGIDVFIELGPTSLLTRIGACDVTAAGTTWLPSLHRDHDDWATILSSLAALYVRGVAVDWRGCDRPYATRRIALPTYPFARDLTLVSPAGVAPITITPEKSASSIVPVSAARGGAVSVAELIDTLRGMIAALLHEDVRTIDATTPLLSLGADSITLTRALQTVQADFGVRVSVRQIFSDLNTIDALARHIHERRPPAPAVVTPTAPAASAVVFALSGPAEPTGTPSPLRQPYLNAFIERYVARTRTSKTLARRNQAHADFRDSVRFSQKTKAMVYPITVEKSRGSTLWDVDGRALVDWTMGFGVNLFGHDPDFVVRAIETQLQRGMFLGPLSDLTNDVAALICELTGCERVVFNNSGTEAVMVALRLARTATTRKTIVMFTGSYHGGFDGVLATTDPGEGGGRAMPAMPGVLDAMVQDTIVLEYGTADALDFIKAHAADIAAVVVEPVQSRRPGLQPRAFLHELRAITRASGTALIFDECVTGFRLHAGGAQAWFGVRADMAIYGKILGGGLPIGAVAGTRQFLDAVDGGAWNEADTAFPPRVKTFVAGTFCKHPLAMAAARAVLGRLRADGPALHTDLNEKAARLATRLNAVLARVGAPMQVDHCGSLFRFTFAGDLARSIDADLFFYHLAYHGVYIWEGRTWFLSTAHTTADIDHFVGAVEKSVTELASGGFLTSSYPLTEAQEQLWVLTQLGGAGFEPLAIEIRGALDLAAIRRGFVLATRRHEALRTVFSPRGDCQTVLSDWSPDIPLVDLSGEDDDRKARETTALMQREASRPFDLAAAPPWRVVLIRLEPERHLLVLTAHHIVLDGWSSIVLLREVFSSYAVPDAAPTAVSPPLQFRDYAAWMRDRLDSGALRDAESYWLDRLSAPLPQLDLPTDRDRPAVKTYQGARETARLGGELFDQVKTLAGVEQCTPFMVLLAAYVVLLHRLTQQSDVIVGFSVNGRFMDGSESMVGYCNHVVPLRLAVDDALPFSRFLATCRSALLEAYDHQEYPFSRLINTLNPDRDPGRPPIVATTFNLEPPVSWSAPPGLTIDLAPSVIGFTGGDLHLNLTELQDGALAHIDYSRDLFEAGTIRRMLDQYRVLLGGIVADPEQPLWALPILTDADRKVLRPNWSSTHAS